MRSDIKFVKDHILQFVKLSSRTENDEAVGNECLILIQHIQDRAASADPQLRAEQVILMIANRLQSHGDASSGPRSDFLCKAAAILRRPQGLGQHSHHLSPQFEGSLAMRRMR